MARRKLWEKPAHPLFIPGVFGKTLSSSPSDLNKSESILRVNAGTEAEAVEGLGQSQFSPVVGRGQGLTGQGGEHLSRVFFFWFFSLALVPPAAQGRANWIRGKGSKWEECQAIIHSAANCFSAVKRSQQQGSLSKISKPLPSSILVLRASARLGGKGFKGCSPPHPQRPYCMLNCFWTASAEFLLTCNNPDFFFYKILHFAKELPV